MKDFLRQNGILLLVIALLLSILIGVLSVVMGGQADPLSNLTNTIVSPLRGGVTAAADWVEGVYTYLPLRRAGAGAERPPGPGG